MSDADSYPPAGNQDRLYGIDWVRGFVIVLMTLDHVRGDFHDFGFSAVDPIRSNPPLFFSRWITHWCATTFVLLTGISIWLSIQRGRSRSQMTGMLILRGLWLIALEATWVHYGFEGNFDFLRFGAGVFWVLGWGMISLAFLIHLPTRLVGVLGLAVVGMHNLLDGYHAESWGSWQPVWGLLHEQTRIEWDRLIPGSTVFLDHYRQWFPGEGGRPLAMSLRWPIGPWIGIMAMGYGLGPVFAEPVEVRRRFFAAFGWLMIALFLVVRAANQYGDTHPWRELSLPSQTALSFLNCQKYPPSLLFICMGLGPVMVILSRVDKPPGPLGRFLIVYGRAPMCYYLLHLPLIQWIGRLSDTWREQTLPRWLLGNDFIHHGPAHHAVLLGTILAGTLLVILLGYWPCQWVGDLKRRHRNSWILYYL